MIVYLKELYKQLLDDDAFGLSAQCAYYFLFSLFPFLLFAMSLLGFLPISSTDVLELVKQVIPANTAFGVEEQIVHILDTKRGGALSFGLLFSLFTSSAAINSIVLAVNKAYGLPDRKSFIHSRILAILLTIAMLVVIVSALVLSVFGHFIGDWMHDKLHVPWDKIQVWNVVRWIINLSIAFVVFLGVYFIAPNTCLTCKEVVPGAIVASCGWQLVSLGFSYYVDNWGNYSATYGSLGGVIVLLTWFYICAFIIILGGEVNAISYIWKKNRA